MSTSEDYEPYPEPYYRAGDPPDYPVCTECGNSCTIHEEDEGIGSYEFWGQKSVDTHWVWLSDCCYAPVKER